MSKEEALRLIKEAAETGATELNLRWQDLTELPPELFELNKLTQLDLCSNHLTSLPPKLFELKNLTELNLDGNQLALLPPEIVQLKNLTELYLSCNRIASLPPEIVQLSKLQWLIVFTNPLVSPPIEIIEQGRKATREYFAALKEGGRELAEVKVILVGEATSGKTSLFKRLRGQQFDPQEPMTHGISINKWRPENAGQLPCCNVWDFGGHEIQNAMHQFFLSRRSLVL